jgi:hypothetical protein
MTAELQEQCAESIETEALFVSSTLATWTTANPEWFARDFQINDTVYRRLDPEYYAWLRSRMALAKAAATAGRLDAAAFEDLRVRFNAMHEWAVQRFGAEKLLAAVRAIRAGEYAPPAAEAEGPPASTSRSASDRLFSEAIALVDAISERALTLGWSRERLPPERSVPMRQALSPEAACCVIAWLCGD